MSEDVDKLAAFPTWIRLTKGDGTGRTGYE
jgi:hypothetical protein